MKFGPVPVAQAIGTILAHSVKLPGGSLRKGIALGAAEVAALQASGREQVIVARLDPTDLHEDAAAGQIAQAMLPDGAGQGLRASVAATGRVNLYALQAGVLAVDVAAITALNRINPMITLACLRPWARVAAGDMVATVKIRRGALRNRRMITISVTPPSTIAPARPIAAPSQ